MLAVHAAGALDAPRERRVGERGRQAQDVGALLLAELDAPARRELGEVGVVVLEQRVDERAAGARVQAGRRGAPSPAASAARPARRAGRARAAGSSGSRSLPLRQPRVRQRPRPPARAPAGSGAGGRGGGGGATGRRAPAGASASSRSTRPTVCGVFTKQRTRAPSPHATSPIGSSIAGSARRSPPSSAGPSQASGGALAPPPRPGRQLHPAADDQPLLRARRRDVHHALLLAGGPRPGAIAQPLVGERRLARAVEADEPQPDLALGDEQVLVAVGGALAAEVGDADDGELEALRGVDGHEPHGLDVAELDRRVGLARLGLELGGGEVGEAADVAAAVALEGRGEAQQLVDVRQPAGAAGERQDVQVIARRVDDAAQQLVEGEPRRQRALGGEARREGVEALAVVVAQARAQLAVAGDRPPGVARSRRARRAPARRRTGRRAATRARRTAPPRRAGWRARRATRRGRARPGAPSSRARRRTSSAAPGPRARARRRAGRRARAAGRRRPRAGARPASTRSDTRWASRRASACRQAFVPGRTSPRSTSSQPAWSVISSSTSGSLAGCVVRPSRSATKPGPGAGRTPR